METNPYEATNEVVQPEEERASCPSKLWWRGLPAVFCGTVGTVLVGAGLAGGAAAASNLIGSIREDFPMEYVWQTAGQLGYFVLSFVSGCSWLICAFNFWTCHWRRALIWLAVGGGMLAVLAPFFADAVVMT